MRFLPYLLLFAMSFLATPTPTPTDAIHILRERREQHALQAHQHQHQHQHVNVNMDMDLVSSKETAEWKAERAAARTKFCAGWGALLRTGGNTVPGTVIGVYSEKLKYDFLWIPDNVDDIKCGNQIDGGCESNICWVDRDKGDMYQLKDLSHIHFARYNLAADTSHLRLSLKDSCLAADNNYHHPAQEAPYTTVTAKAPAAKKILPFVPSTCTKNPAQDKATARQLVIEKWNAMFG